MQESLYPTHSGEHSRLPVPQRYAIIAYWKEDQSITDIARKVGTHRDTVNRWIKHYQQHGNCDDNPHPGRPRCTDESTDINIAVAAYVQPFTSPKQLKHELDLGDISTDTIDRRLKEAGLFGRVARHKWKYTEEHKRKRLSFANGYRDWTEEKWEKVLFSDESIFYGAGFCGRTWVRRPVGEELNPDFCVDQKPHQVKVNVWGCFCAAGVGYLYIFNETLDKKLLRKIFNDGHLLQSAEDRGLVDQGEWWFVQDNDPKHRSAEVQTWLFNHGITSLDFPPYSPDLNPIEHVWNDVARRIESEQASTMEQLQDCVEAAWEATSVELLRTLVHSMPRRCQAVVDAQGDHTKY
jgi:transposase